MNRNSSIKQSEVLGFVVKVPFHLLCPQEYILSAPPKITGSEARSQLTLKPSQPLQALVEQLQTTQPGSHKKGPPDHRSVDHTGAS